MSNDSLIGKKLANRYEILELIGTGGMASVYKAKCELLKRYVAIKVLRDNLKDDEAVVKSFNKEAQSAASLSDNNIVSVFDVGESDGIDYMVMEYVDGITLKRYIKENGVLPWQTACDFAIQIGNALSVAHGQNIIHRDIKPQNILMTKDNVLKVTDFGIAKATAAETMIMGGANAMGSVHYISPEQARGGYTDERSDLYSLGIVLYEMLAGKVPFDGESAVAVALMHIEKEPTNIRDLNHDIPADLARVVEKAISKEQINRYQSAMAFVNDLRAVLAGEPLVSEDAVIGNGDLEETQIVDTKKVNEVASVPADVEDEALSEPQEESAKKKKKKKKQKTPEQKKADKTATIMAVVTMIVILLLSVGGYAVYKFNTGSGLIPDLTNMTLEEAQSECDKKGFKLSDSVEYSLSDKVDADRIISQNPAAKSVANKEDEIKVVISLGASGGNIAVPGVTGLTAEEAITKLIDAELTYTITEVHDDKVEEGRVIRQLPEEGTMVNKDEIIALSVSVGKGTDTVSGDKVKVPSVIGDTREKAEASLKEAGLNVGSVGRKPSSSPVGTVISQSPAADKTAPRDSRVNIVLSSGPSDGEETAEATQSPQQTATASPKPDNTATPKPTEKPTSTPVPEKNDDNGVTKRFSLVVPEGKTDVQVKITANGKTVYDEKHNGGERVSVDITSSGQTNILAYIDGDLVSNKQMDFK